MILMILMIVRKENFLIRGRLKPFTLNNKQGFLITETDIYFIDVNENTKKLFASGFRNPQGYSLKMIWYLLQIMVLEVAMK